MRKTWLLAAAAALFALPVGARAQFIGTDGLYDMNRTTGNTFTSIIGDPGTTVLTTTGDDSSFAFTFAAPFTYYGTVFNGANASTNGLIAFTAVNTGFTNQDLSIASVGGRPVVAGFWDDANFNVAGATGTLAQLNAGTTTTLEWNNVPFFGGTATDTVTYQVVFDSATGNINMNYISTSNPRPNTGGSATVGIQGVSTFIQAGFNTVGTVNDGDALLITAAAVPEPGTMTLCGLAVAAGLAKFRRRKAA